MKLLIQRVLEASVSIDGNIVGEIKKGLLVFVGIAENDKEEDVLWLSQKLIQLRIFSDEMGLMNKNILEVEGEILIISQFTLHAKTKKGNRPSFIQAAIPEIAIPLYNKFIEKMKTHPVKKVEQGVFGANMQISLINDGPVTIIIDSKNKE